VCSALKHAEVRCSGAMSSRGGRSARPSCAWGIGHALRAHRCMLTAPALVAVWLMMTGIPRCSAFCDDPFSNYGIGPYSATAVGQNFTLQLQRLQEVCLPLPPQFPRSAILLDSHVPDVLTRACSPLHTISSKMSPVEVPTCR
jgi:hypothetical protein